MSHSKRSIRIAIDRGGTFTDVFAQDDAIHSSNLSRQIHFKLLSVDPKNYNDANVEGIRRVLIEFTGQPHPRHTPLITDRYA
jgi:5-oxoprolinase (ATP-hydrolysing)